MKNESTIVLKRFLRMVAGSLCLLFWFPAIALSDGVVCFGDSITAGSGGVAGYPAHLAGLVSMGVTNQGSGGETTSKGVNRISGVLSTFSPEYIIIMEGANDAFWGVSPSTVKYNLGVMIDKSVGAGAVPILSPITPNQRDSGMGSAIPLNYNPPIVALAGEKGVTLVDSYGNNIANWSNLTIDGLHTNEAGSISLAQGFSGALGGGSGGGGGGCFIATAAFGTTLEPQVVLLKEFRDQYLLTNTAGQFFVKKYYQYSPPVADYISQHSSVRMLVRAALYPLIGFSYFMVNMGLGAKLLFSSVFLMVIFTTLIVLRRRFGSNSQKMDLAV